MKAVQIFISYINLIFIFLIISLCLKIGNTNEYVLYFSVLFGVGMLAYTGLKQVFLKKGLFLTIGLFICFIVILLMEMDSFIGENTFNKLFVEIPNEFVYLYSNFESISVNLILPYMIILIPIIAIIYTHNALKGRNFIGVIINIILMIVLWFWHYESILTKYSYIYCCIGVFSFMFDGYYRVLKKYKGNLNKRVRSFAAFFIVSLFITGIIYASITNVSDDHSGVYSDLIYTRVNGFDDGRFTSSSDKNHKFQGIDSITEVSKEKIGGSLNVDNTPQFEVKAKRPVYLEASIKNKYDDDSNTWDNDYEKLIKIPKKAFIYDDKYVKNNKYYPEKKLYSTLKNLKVNKFNIEIGYDKNMLFHPYLTYSVNNINTFLSPQNSIFKEDDIATYNISYYDYGEDMTLDKAYNEEIGEDKIFKDDNGNTTFTDKEYKEYKKYNEKFISGYSNVDDRIVKLVKKIVKGAKSDTEKAYRIEQYLKKNYTYSLEVKNIDRNLLYNFLFNEKKGYCVYFATAMTVMCKIANVPARYVEGVKMINRKNSDGNYVVTNADAHAWTEVLINSSLNMWYIADATPSAAQYIYENSENNKITHNSGSEKTRQSSSIQNQQSVKSIVKKDDNKQKGKSTNVKKNTLIKKKVNYKFHLLVICIFVIFLLRALYKIIIIRRALNYKGVLKLYNYCQRRLESVGIYKPLNVGEIEFSEAIKDNEISNIIRYIADRVYSEYYGNGGEGKFDKKSFYNKFEELMRKRQGRVKYYFFKYLW